MAIFNVKLEKKDKIILNRKELTAILITYNKFILLLVLPVVQANYIYWLIVLCYFIFIVSLYFRISIQLYRRLAPGRQNQQGVQSKVTPSRRKSCIGSCQRSEKG